MQFLDFERPIAELQSQIDSLRKSGEDGKLNFDKEVQELSKKVEVVTQEIFENLSDWQMIQLARHPDAPYTLNYFQNAFTDFDEFHGDRNFGDDPAIVGGLACLNDQVVMVIGQQKGRTTKEKIYRNFGMPHPEGYRKALRLMKMAEQFG